MMGSSTARFARFRQFALAVVLLFVAGRGYAQIPFPSFAYVVGTNPSTRLASQAHRVGGTTLADTWIVFVHRNIASSLRRGSGYFIRSMRLFHPRLPNMRWDTVVGSPWPLLVVTRGQGAEVLNRADGSVAGLNFGREGKIDLFISDPSGRVAARLEGLVLEIETLDGTFQLPVQAFNFYDRQY